MSVRVYPRNGAQYPSVTSVLSLVFGVGEYLNRWSVKVGAEKIIENLNMGKSPDELLALAENARKEILKQAQIKGRVVHGWIEDKINGKDDDDYALYEPYFKAFLKFLSEHEVKPILQEYVVFNDEYEYAGRLDFYGLVDGEPCLLDFKTSKHIRAEYGLQLAAYRECLERSGRPVHHTYVLHLRESKRYTLKEFNVSFAHFAELLPVFRQRFREERPSVTVASVEDAIMNEKNPEGLDSELLSETIVQGQADMPEISPAQFPDILLKGTFPQIYADKE